MSERHHERAAERVFAAAENGKPTHPLADPFLRPRQVAEGTGRHYVSILNAIKRGELKASKVGRRALGVRASEVSRWLASFNDEAA